MSRADLRVVEYTVTQSVKSKKGKKSSKKVKLAGFFHIWGSNADKKGKEKFFGLVEDANTGKLIEVDYKNIRFLSEAEIDGLYEAEVEEIATAEEETTETASESEKE